VQEAGHLPNKYEALSANPSTDEKKRKEEGRGEVGEGRKESLVPVPHTCNPSSLGGRDQED
jgi:hypothetical protein